MGCLSSSNAGLPDKSGHPCRNFLKKRGAPRDAAPGPEKPEEAARGKRREPQ